MNEDLAGTESQGLRLVVEGLTGVPGKGRVALINGSETTLRVWRTGSQWGDSVLSFQAQRSAMKVHVVRQPQDYTVNVRSTVLVPPGASHHWSFDFGDGTWEADIPFRQWAGPGAKLSALYRVDADPDSLAYNVWIGTLQSEPVPWRD